MNLKDYFLKGLSYQEYWDLIENYAREEKTSGPVKSSSLIGYTKLNYQRMKRLNKLHKPSGLSEERSLTMKWLVITETWCADAAQSMPIMNAIAEEWGIELKVVFRDENPDLMDAFLTKGARAIPILVMCDEDYNVLASWGPRPQHLQKLMEDFKAGVLSATVDEVKKEMQTSYNKDKGNTIIKELNELLGTLHKSN